MIFVKVAKLGQPVKEVSLEDGASIDSALRAASFSADGYQIRVNGRTPCGPLVNGDNVTLVPAIKGGF